MALEGAESGRSRFEDDDERAYDRLVEAIAASQGTFALLIAVGDDPFQEEAVIRRYEGELRQTEGILGFEVRLSYQDPSLRATLQREIDRSTYLQSGKPAVLSVRGAGGLSGFNFGAAGDATELDRFFGYLQWTREAIGHIPYPIVLWLTPRLYKEIGRKSPDFWSWRRGTFQFRQRTPVQVGGDRPFATPERVAREGDRGLLSIADLEAAIAAEEATTQPNRPKLARLWAELGWAYAEQIQRGEAASAQTTAALAADWLERAIALQRELDLKADLVNSYRWLGLLKDDQSDYTGAIAAQEQSLAIAREIGDRSGEAKSLCNLGNTYASLGQHQRVASLGISYAPLVQYRWAIGGVVGLAASPGISYAPLERYQRAINFHEQSLAITREIGDRGREAGSLIGLGNAYSSLGQYQRAIDFYEQSLAIKREIGDRRGEAISLGNLGLAYSSLGQYQRAIDFHEQHLAIAREIGDRRGEANSLGSLGIAYSSLGQYQQAIDFHEQYLAIAREIGDRWGQAASLHGLGNAWAKLGKTWQAKTSYEAARNLFRDLGLTHMVKACEASLNQLLQVIPVEIPRAPLIEEPPPPPTWALERFDDSQPRRARQSRPPWWVRLWRAWQH